jgi:hypothetical protein
MLHKILIILFITIPFFIKAQAFENSEIFIGEITEDHAAVYLGDSLVFHVTKGERFYARYILPNKPFFAVTRADGSNGRIFSDKVIRSADQTFFKISYSENFFPFAKKPSVYGTSVFSNCTYRSVISWQSHFSDTMDFTGLSEKAYHKDTIAFLELLSHNALDSEGHSQWGYNNWKLINAYTDKELATFLFNRISKNNNRNASQFILPYAIQTPVFGDEQDKLLKYYESNYPLTFAVYALEQLSDSKLFNKKYKKLKKMLFSS